MLWQREHAPPEQPEAPEFREIFRDVLISVLVGFLPFGYNYIAHKLGLPAIPIDGPVVTGLAFVCSFLIAHSLLFGWWASKAIKSAIVDFPKQATSTEFRESVRDAITGSVAGILLADAALDQHSSRLHNVALHNYLSKLRTYPTPVRRVAHLFAEDHLQSWATQMSSFGGVGLDLDVGKQIAVLRELSRGSRAHWIIDPRICENPEKNWSAEFRDFLRWLAELDVSRNYIILASLKGASASIRGIVIKKMRVMQRYLEGRKFKVWFCDQQDVRDGDPDCQFFDKLLYILDDASVVSIRARADYTGGQELRTVVGEIQAGHRTLIDQTKRYKVEVPFS